MRRSVIQDNISRLFYLKCQLCKKYASNICTTCAVFLVNYQKGKRHPLLFANCINSKTVLYITIKYEQTNHDQTRFSSLNDPKA